MNKIVRFSIALLAASALAVPVLALAAPEPADSTPVSKPSTNMIKSEKLLKDLFKQSDDEKAKEQFFNIVMPRLKYSTVRSLAGRSDKWLVFVDIYQLYKSGKPDGYKIQQATLQYGIHGLPPYSISCTLNVGTFSSTIERSARSVYIFDYATLNKDAKDGDVSVDILEFSSNSKISLTQNMPGKVMEADTAIKTMAESYIAYYKSQSANGEPVVTPIDCATLKLRSYVTDTASMAMNYTWELMLVHNNTFPANATIIRYNIQTGKATVSMREITSY